jgi:hypothetical protein
MIQEITGSERINLSYEEEKRLFDCFAFEGSKELSIDFENMTMTGELKLVKVTQTLEDEDLQKMMGIKGIESLAHRRYDNDAATLTRANEILDIIDAPKETTRCRSIRKKVYGIRSRLTVIFKDNVWRIRDMELANKVGEWCRDYIEKGNLAALTNLCKLKVMTHNEMPIYSIEEEK